MSNEKLTPWQKAGGKLTAMSAPQRGSGTLRVRWEDFSGTGLAKLAGDRPAFYRYLHDELPHRRALCAVIGASVDATDQLILERIERALAHAKPEAAAEVRRMRDEWRAAIGNIERVTPTEFRDTAPGAA